MAQSVISAHRKSEAKVGHIISSLGDTTHSATQNTKGNNGPEYT